MAVLYEMGLAHRIPQSAVHQMSDRLKFQLVPFFFNGEVPEGRDPTLDAPCPCQLGNIYQILSATGLNMDEVLPWARSWFFRYQMSDGGFNCDETAYRVHPQASSIVGTIAPLEAVLYFTKRPFTSEEEQFLDRGAKGLIERKLMLGCQSEHNAEERADEEDWLKLCFPRFYLYDVLRGLKFILHWAEKRQQQLPLSAISAVISILEKKSSDGNLRMERQSFTGVGTRIYSASEKWGSSSEASLFPLLNEVSQIGQICPYLTRQWQEAKAKIRLIAGSEFV